MFLYAFLNGYNGYYKTQEVHKNITLKPCKLRYVGGNQTPQLAKMQLARLYICSEWGEPLKKPQTSKGTAKIEVIFM